MEHANNQILISFVVSTFAGLATGLGGLIVVLTQKTTNKALAFALNFSAGVMIYVASANLLPEAKRDLIYYKDYYTGVIYLLSAFFLGFVLVYILDRFLPNTEAEKSCRYQKILDLFNRKRRLFRLGLLTAVTIALHNLPEGMATFMGSMKDLSIGLPIALAIGIHNIPEGVAVAMPIYCATRSRAKTLAYSFASGLTEPLGALLTYLVLDRFINDIVLSLIFSAVAGVMIFISINELIPAGYRYGGKTISIIGFMTGILSMATGLLFALFK